MLRDGDAELVVNGEPGLPWSSSRGATSDIGVSGVGASEPAVAGSEPPVAVDEPGVCDQGAANVCLTSGDEYMGCDQGGACAPPPGEVYRCEPPCPEGMSCTQVCAEPGGAAQPMPEPERADDVPSVEEAEALVRRLFDAAGLDLDGAAVTTVDLFSAVEVRIDPVVGGLPTSGMTWNAVVGAGDEVQYASGWLAAPEQGDRYSLVGTTSAVARLQEAPQAAPAIAIAIDCGPGAECPDIEPVERTITGARLALQLVPAFGAEEAFLVPSYLFTLDDGGELAAFAVADEHLVPPPGAEPPVLTAPPVVGGDESVSSPPSEGTASGPADGTASGPATTYPRQQQECSTAQSGPGEEGNQALIVELCVSVAPAGEGRWHGGGSGRRRHHRGPVLRGTPRQLRGRVGLQGLRHLLPCAGRAPGTTAW